MMNYKQFKKEIKQLLYFFDQKIVTIQIFLSSLKLFSSSVNSFFIIAEQKKKKKVTVFDYFFVIAFVYTKLKKSNILIRVKNNLRASGNKDMSIAKK